MIHFCFSGFKSKKILPQIVGVLICVSAAEISAQVISVSGVVSHGSEKLPGVSILVKGSGTGTQTDASGTYAINANVKDTLVFSYVGFASQSIPVAGRKVIDVALANTELSLDEVVVVGYGEARRSHLTGAVSNLAGASVKKGSGAVPNATNLLQGRIAGLEIIRPSGRPGNDNPSIRLRGLGSFGASSSPLVLVDGVVGSLSTIAADDIENISVMKDAASASIYGARAANGVILVTTRKAKRGDGSIEYKFDIGFQTPTRLPELIWNSGEYMDMSNIARRRSGLAPFYTDQQINDYKTATDPALFPNFDWPDYYFKTAKILNHYLNVAKGTENSRFRLGLNYSRQDGVLPGFDSKRISANLNYEGNISKRIKVGTIVNFFKMERKEPQGATGTVDLIRGVYGRSPLAGPYLPDGRKSSGRAYTTEPFSTFAPIAFSNGSISSESYNINPQVYANIEFSENLTWETKAALNYSQTFSKRHSYATPNQFYFYQKLLGESDYTIDQSVGRPLSLGVTDNNSFSATPTFYSILKFNKRLKDHEFNTMVGFEQQSNKSRNLSGTRVNFPTTGLAELNAGSPDGQSLSGTASEWALQSIFGRLAYNFKERYMVEGNLRYDGTSRVFKENRWGLFPSISAGWRVSEESFVKDNLSWVNSLKLRGSLGLLGNQEIGLYPYQDIFSYANYTYGTSVEQGVKISRMTDKHLEWEKTLVLDFGLDFDLSRNFGLAFDWYRKRTFDILSTLPVPASLGLSGPITNNGALKNTGLELELNYRNSIGKLFYSTALMASGFRNKVVSIVTPTKGVVEVGLPYNSYYLYEWDGIFQNQTDIDNWAHQNNNPKPGDLRIKDQDGNGVVDGDDRVSYNRFPNYSYSFNLNLEWKGVTASVFMQGVQGSYQLMNDWSSYPFREGIPPHVEYRNAWTEENPTNLVPAVHEFSYAGVYGYTSTYLLKKSSYLRLKNVYVAYQFPTQLSERIGFKNVSVYFSANDLLTFTRFRYGDPEASEGNSLIQYPQLKSTNLGINIKL